LSERGRVDRVNPDAVRYAPSISSLAEKGIFMSDTRDVPQLPDDQLLRDIVDRIVEAVQPERIILFGSAARGQMNRHSDLDILVIKPGVHRGKTTDEIYRRMIGAGYPVDIIVAHPEDIERYSDSPALVFHEAVHSG
jgi:uncharacterized protein